MSPVNEKNKMPQPTLPLTNENPTSGANRYPPSPTITATTSTTSNTSAAEPPLPPAVNTATTLMPLRSSRPRVVSITRASRMDVTATGAAKVMPLVFPRQAPDPAANEAEQREEEQTDDEDEEEEDDIEFIQLPPKKKSRSTPAPHNAMDHTCVRCRWRKRNSECQLRMCLSCCVESGQECNQHFHVAAKSSKNAILFLEREIKAGNKLKTLPKPIAMVHTLPAHLDITEFLQRGTNTTTTTTTTSTPALIKDYTATTPHASLLPSPPFAYAEPSNLHTFLASIQLQQYLPILINNGFETMTAMCTLNELLLDALGIHSLGHRAMLLSAVAQLRQSRQQQHQQLSQQHPRRAM